jgi:cysteine synthase
LSKPFVVLDAPLIQHDRCCQLWNEGISKKGDKLIEATSGNTGIALAMIAQLFHIEIEFGFTRRFTKERTNNACIWRY